MSTHDSKTAIRQLLRDIVGDISVDLGEEFDRNFERQAFFSRAWQRHRSPLRRGDTILIDSGRLRRSIQRPGLSDSSVTFSSTLPYADIHNSGGTIKVTPRMKGYFRHRYREATAAFGRKKNGTLRQDKRNLRLSTEAEFYRAMALQPVGKTIHIPQRQFIGYAPEVDSIVRQVINDALDDFFRQRSPI